ncbi:MAG: YhdP family protein, partial [Luteimonas sp.]
MHHRLHQLRRAAWYSVAGVLVTMALVAGAVSQLLPLAERHPERIAQWLSARAQRAVQFDHVQTEWTRRGPLLRLDGLRIGDGADAVAIGAAEILVSQYAGLLPGRSFTELRLRGLELTLQRDNDGRWTVRGLPGNARASDDPFAPLQGLGELQVIGGKLRVDAPALGIDARLPSIDVRLQVDGHVVRLGARAVMHTGAAAIELRARLDRASGDGRAYLLADAADLADWSTLLHAGGIAVTGGRGRLQGWSDLRAHRVSAVTIASNLRGVALRGAALGDGTPPPTARFDTLQVQGRWRTVDGGWRLDLPQLRIGAAARPQSLDGLAVAGGTRYALRA